MSGNQKRADSRPKLKLKVWLVFCGLVTSALVLAGLGLGAGTSTAVSATSWRGAGMESYGDDVLENDRARISYEAVAGLLGGTIDDFDRPYLLLDTDLARLEVSAFRRSSPQVLAYALESAPLEALRTISAVVTTFPSVENSSDSISVTLRLEEPIGFLSLEGGEESLGRTVDGRYLLNMRRNSASEFELSVTENPEGPGSLGFLSAATINMTMFVDDDNSPTRLTVSVDGQHRYGTMSGELSGSVFA